MSSGAILPILRVLIAGIIVLPAAVSHARHPEWLSTSDSLGEESVAPADAYDVEPDRFSELRDAGFGFVELVHGRSLQIHENGNLKETLLLMRHFVSEDGVRQGGNLQLSVRPSVESVSIDAAFQLADDGSRSVVTPASIQVVSESSLDIFSDSSTVVVPYTRLRVGSTAVLVVTRTIRTREWPLPWSRIYWPQDFVPVERFEVDVTWEKGVPAPEWSSNLLGLTCSTHRENAMRCSRFGIEAIRNDPDVRSWLDEMPNFIVGERVTWSEVSRREAELVEAAASSLAAPVIESEGTSREHLERIYRFVADEIRYVAFEAGTGAVVPRDASVTIERGYGDCKDKVALFLALARQAGLDAYPVLVASNRYRPDRLIQPGWRWFDHMMACVEDVEPEPICVELTTPYAGIGELPQELEGSTMLELRTTQPVGLAPRSLHMPRHSWRMRSFRTSHVDCDGNIEEETQLQVDGSAAVWIRSGLNGLTALERARWLNDLYTEARGFEADVEIEAAGLDTPGTGVRISTLVTHKRVIDPLRWTSWVEREPWLAFFAEALRTQNRHHSYFMRGIDFVSQTHYSVCPAFSPSVAFGDLDLRTDLGQYVRSHTRAERSITFESRFSAPTRTIEVIGLPRFSKFIDAVVEQSEFGFAVRRSE